MYTVMIEFLSLALFIGCLWHAVRYRGWAFAQQWFLAAFLYVFIRETIEQVWLQDYFFASSILRLGAAPAVVGLLWGCVFYLALQFSTRFVSAKKHGLIAALMFVIAASFSLPIEATAFQLSWWSYVDPGHTLFGGVPIAVPLVWGGAAAIFYAIFVRVSDSRLPERGRLYAMVIFAPIIAVAHLIYALALGFVVK